MTHVSKSNLFNTHTGILKKDACIVLVKTEWNADITHELENGCKKVLEKYSVKTSVITVPGAFEIPFAIKHYWKNCKKKNRPDAFIALGCVVKGETSHYEYVCKAVTEGILYLNLILPVPVIFGVLTVHTIDQAKERIGGLHGHKGEEAAITAVKMIQISKTLTK